MTISGGEPLHQSEFTREVLKACKTEDLHTTVDTCGDAAWDVLREIMDYTDMLLYDLKFVDSEKHQQYTGVSNEVILNNLYKLTNMEVTFGINMLALVDGVPRLLPLKRALIEHIEHRRFLAFFKRFPAYNAYAGRNILPGDLNATRRLFRRLAEHKAVSFQELLAALPSRTVTLVGGVEGRQSEVEGRAEQQASEGHRKKNALLWFGHRLSSPVISPGDLDQRPC